MERVRPGTWREGISLPQVRKGVGISQNVALVGRGEYIAKRWNDISIHKPEKTRNPEEIIAHMKKKIASV